MRPARLPGPGRALAWALALAGLLLSAVVLALSAVPALFGKDVGAGFASVERSLCALAPDGSAEILIGGDSRAKFQVDPLLLDSLTGRKAVNISEVVNFGGDLPTLANVLRKYPPVLGAHPILIVSVSASGINDLDFASMSASAVLNWTPWDHARAASRRPSAYFAFVREWYLPFLKRHVRRLAADDAFECGEDVRLPPALAASRGFLPGTGRFHPPGQASRRPGPASPQAVLLEGGRWRAFRKSLSWLARSQARAVVLYNAPLVPGWGASPDGAADMELERRFADLVAREASRHARVRFIDFVREPPAGIGPSHFLDNYHLNLHGAALFTRHLGSYLAREGLLAAGPRRDAPPGEGASEGAGSEQLP